MSTFFFPLRTNVEYFHSEESYLGLRGRVKQALLLYDQVVFQAGVYSNLVGPKGQLDLVRPFNPEFDRELEYSVELVEPEFFVEFKTEEDPSWKRLFTSKKDIEYRAQFHNLVNEINSHGIDNVSLKAVDLSANGKELIDKLTQLDEENLDWNPENIFLKRTIIKNLNTDLLLSSFLRIPVSIDGLHAPLLSLKSSTNWEINAEYGFISIEAILPFVGNLHWEEIGELRSHPALIEFRSQMVKIERLVRESLNHLSRDDLQRRILQIHNTELLQEIKPLIPSRNDLAMDVVLEIGANLLPPMGFIKSGAEFLGKISELNQFENTWLAMLMKLQDLNR